MRGEFLIFAFLSTVVPIKRGSRPFHYGNPREEVQCHCVLPHLCADNDAAVNGHGLLDPRIYNGEEECPKFDEICCENPTADPEDEDADNNINVEKETYPKIPSKLCGNSNADRFESRITSEATQTKFGELPWNLIILESANEINQKSLYRCGGSLIHPQVALTAAHCVSDTFLESPDKIIVRAGDWDTNSNKERLPYQDAHVDEVLVHPNFNPSSLKNDIAILFLNEPFVLSDNVGIICLPDSMMEVSKTDCIASGWGKDNLRNGRYSSILKKLRIPIISRDKCLHQLRNTRLGRMYNLHRSFVCAGGEKNKDTCKGDGGGPLICPLAGQRGRFIQMGIVSWGIGCGTDNVPGIYVNVPMYSGWIDAEVSDRGLDTGLYKV